MLVIMTLKKTEEHLADYLKQAEKQLHTSGLTKEQVDSITMYVSLGIDYRLAKLGGGFEAAVTSNIQAPVFSDNDQKK